MSVTKIYPFDTPANYTYDTDKIEVTGGVAKLKLQSDSLPFIENFDNDTGFTYDNTKAEFIGGKVQQVDKAPTDSVCWATYTTNKDLNVSINGGVLTGTLNNGATVSGGYLDLTGGSSSYADYAGLNNVDTLIQEGAIKLIVKPNYSGTPVGIRNFVVIAEASGDSSNLINIYHKSSDGNIKIVINNQTTGTIMTQDMGIWNPTAGVDYEFELNFIIDTATPGNTFIRFFIDGTQFGVTKTGVIGTRSSNIGLIRLGTNFITGNLADHSVKDVIFYDSVQHTSNYVPGYTIEETRYIASPVVLPEMEHIGDGSILSFDSFVTVESGTPRYTLQIGQSGNYLYWDGAAWSISDGTYAQANDETTFNTNVGTLPVAGEKYGQFKINFTGSNTISDVDTLIATMTVNTGYPVDNPSIKPADSLGIEKLEGFSSIFSGSGLDGIKYILLKGITDYYWDGAAWSVSDGTYAQSNTASEISANKETFTTSIISFNWKALLHSDDSTTTPELERITIEYDFAQIVVPPSLTVVHGIALKPDGSPDTRIITVNLNVDANESLGNNQIRRHDIYIQPRDNGYWEQNLANNEDMEPNSYYQFRWHDRLENKIVAKQDTQEYNELEDYSN